MQGDVRMVCCLVHLWRQHAHGTVIGGKNIIEPCHPAANGGILLNKMNIYPTFRQVKGRLDTCYSPPYYQHIPVGRDTFNGQWVKQPCPCNSHDHKVFGFLCGIMIGVSMHP